MAKSSSSFTIGIPATISGRTFTITPGSKGGLDGAGEVIQVENSTVSGDNSEFYSGNYSSEEETLLFTATFEVTGNFTYTKKPVIIITGEDKANGFFKTKYTYTENADGNVIICIIECYFQTYPEDHMIFQAGIVTIGFSDIDITEPAVATKLITNYVTTQKISSNLQSVSLVVKGEELAKFRVTVTGSDGTTNLMDHQVYTCTIDATNPEPRGNMFNSTTAINVMIPIPAKATDVTWTVTILPETGTSLASGLTTASILQEGLRVLTFSQDNTGVTNMTFPSQQVKYSANQSSVKKFIERKSNSTSVAGRGGKDFKKITIVITAESGVATLRAGGIGLITTKSAFTNIFGSNIRIQNLQAVQTSTTVVTLTFDLVVTSIQASLTSQIKLNQFLINA